MATWLPFVGTLAALTAGVVASLIDARRRVLRSCAGSWASAAEGARPDEGEVSRRRAPAG